MDNLPVFEWWQWTYSATIHNVKFGNFSLAPYYKSTYFILWKRTISMIYDPRSQIFQFILRHLEDILECIVFALFGNEQFRHSKAPIYHQLKIYFLIFGVNGCVCLKWARLTFFVLQDIFVFFVYHHASITRPFPETKQKKNILITRFQINTMRHKGFIDIPIIQRHKPNTKRRPMDLFTGSALEGRFMWATAAGKAANNWIFPILELCTL